MYLTYWEMEGKRREGKVEEKISVLVLPSFVVGNQLILLKVDKSKTSNLSIYHLQF